MRLLSAFIVSVIVINLAGIWIPKWRRSQTPDQKFSLNHAQGLTRAEIEERWKIDLTKVEGSFSILVSKNLHHLEIPDTNQFWRMGTSYTILEFAEDKLAAVHQVSG